MKDVVVPDPAASSESINEVLKEMQEDAISSVLDGIFSESEIIEQQMIYERDDQSPELLPNMGQFVGFQISAADRTNISVQIHALSLYFKGSGVFNIYLFNHLKKAPVGTFEVSVLDGEEVIVNLPETILSAISSVNKSRVFYLGYFQNDIESVGIQAYDWPRLQRGANCYSVQGFEAEVIGDDDFIRFDVPLTSRTYGLNAELSSAYDYTEVILRKQQLFDKAIGLQMAAKVIEKVVHSLRSNLNERIGEEGVQRLYTDLNLDMATPELPYSSGIKNQLRRELKRVHDNLFVDKKITATTSPEGCYTPRFLR
ncbi:hypothetical protein [Chitinophaga sp. sic0106]|uniref:hypothetical protein n=1 Tax=Chitinophaga sp. sic0106 TaxID=2854785 RepID=UPI001C489620|nr:hypothetical protein [Chitinophaga sp. sic0106]MBV7531342.1 hypothetical protein [Chitinophaga sp. sic0106]